MTPVPQYVRFLWTSIQGPKLMILLASGIAGMASGAVIAAINSGIATWAEGEVPWQAMATFIGAQGLWIVSVYFAQLRAAHSVNKLVFDMRTDAVERVARTELSKVEDLRVGKIVTMLEEDTHAIGRSVMHIILSVRGLVTVAFALVYVALLSVAVAALAILAIAIGAFAYLYQEKRARPLATEMRRSHADFHNAVNDLVQGSKESRFHLEGEAAHLRHIRRLGVRGRTLTARSDLLSFGSASVTHLILIGLLGLIAFLPPSAIAATGVPVLQSITVMLFLVGGIEAVVEAANPITRGQVAHAAYNRIWDQLGPEARAAPPMRQTSHAVLEAKDLTYAYPTDEGQFQLGPINLRFEAPELVFITGGNGSGKTTLLKCLTGLYEPHGGAVLLNGQPALGDGRTALRSQAAAVFHDYHLFARLYGHALSGRRTQITNLIEAFDLSHKVSLGPRGFSSTRLSTGQRKRLGLIATLLLDRSIIVLDEFGAEQDPEFRERFYRGILPSLRDEGRLVLAVTHDDRYFDYCDRRIHLDYGQIVEDTVQTAVAREPARLGTAD